MENYNRLLSLLPDSKFSGNYDLFLNEFSLLNNLENTVQDNYYHAEGDVWTHAKMVCDALISQKNYKDATEENKFIMFYAALLHDVGKPFLHKN